MSAIWGVRDREVSPIERCPLNWGVSDREVSAIERCPLYGVSAIERCPR